MLAINSTMMAVNLQTVNPRSPLAANQILLRLGQAFAGATFTSRQASNVLGLDFLYTAKKLFRMRRNNLLNVAAREPRIEGGYENRYQISPHGFRKINHLTKGAVSMTDSTATKQEPDMISQALASQYLLAGTGTIQEMFDRWVVKIATSDVHASPVTDELGRLLWSFDETFLPGEIFSKHFFNSSPLEASQARLVTRATHLQQLGLIPKDIDVSTFIVNAIIAGSTEPAILVGLLLRGSIQLKADEITRRLGETVSQSLVLQTGSLKCQSCLDYRLSLIEVKSENSLLKDRCLDLQQKLWEASEKALWDRFSHWQQLTYMERRIERLFECLVIIAKGLNKYPNTDPLLILMRDFVQESFIIMAAMNLRRPVL
jgi:hypothetical protein